MNYKYAIFSLMCLFGGSVFGCQQRDVWSRQAEQNAAQNAKAARIYESQTQKIAGKSITNLTTEDFRKHPQLNEIAQLHGIAQACKKEQERMADFHKTFGN